MVEAIKTFFDLKSAILGAMLMATLVGLVNSGHGLTPALTAAAKQGIYTFFVAGFIMQYCRWLAQRNLAPRYAVALATLLPTVITVVMVYTLHSAKGTPEPVWSTVPVVILCLVSFFLASRHVVYASPSD